MGRLGYVSYCWSIGTTSFRTKEFNRKIEAQLAIMQRFRALPENVGKNWKANKPLQKAYYEYMQECGFVEGQAQRPDKDAREKTSGLCDIGVLDTARNITPVGERLLSVAADNDFSTDNDLEIEKDSYIYFKQLLKMYTDIGGNIVRPFVVTLYVLHELEYLSYEEFTYLLPLCINSQTMELVMVGIKKCRQGKMTIDDMIGNVLQVKDNYQTALAYFQTQRVTEQVICEIGLNRKSATYDKSYYPVYKELHDIVFDGKEDCLPLYEALGKVKTKSWWRKLLFETNSTSVIKKQGRAALQDVPILQVKSENAFRKAFFALLHLYKAKATLGDYFDLNRRYMKATDTIIFHDGKVELDVLPTGYVADVRDSLQRIMFQKSYNLYQDLPLAQIENGLAFVQENVYHNLSVKFGYELQDTAAVKQVVEAKRYERFNRLIDKRFTPVKLIELFDYFESRNDEKLRELITDNADVPTMFEYCLGIAWYLISGRQGQVLEYMNLSLESDLLPKTHAGGGEADIVWKYAATDDYPCHTLLLEATLADGTNQRRMEMEPVSRHLGEYLLAHEEEEAYCVFVTTSLALQVIADFRGRKHIGYWKREGDEERSVDNMKIIPLKTEAIKTFLHLGFQYAQLYDIFSKAYASDVKSPSQWYETHIVKETELRNRYS